MVQVSNSTTNTRCLTVGPNTDRRAFANTAGQIITAMQNQNVGTGLAQSSTLINGLGDQDIKRLMNKLIQKADACWSHNVQTANTFDAWVQLFNHQVGTFDILLPSAHLISSADVQKLNEMLKNVVMQSPKLLNAVYPTTFNQFSPTLCSRRITRLRRSRPG